MHIIYNYLLIYLVITALSMLFKPMRNAWKSFFVDFVFKNLKLQSFSDIYNIILNNKGWRRLGLSLKYFPKIILLLIVRVLVIILMTIFVFFPIIQISFAIEEVRYEKNLIYPRSKWDTDNYPRVLHFDLDLPFLPSVEEIILVDDGIQPALNTFILKHYHKICLLFSKKRYQFVYLPNIKENVATAEVLHYMFPNLECGHFSASDEDMLAVLKQHLLTGELKGPALIHYRPYRVGAESMGHYYFSHIRLNLESKIPILQQFADYLKNVTKEYVEDDNVRYRVKNFPDEIEDTADYFFDKNNEELLEEVRIRVIALRKRGIQQYMLRELVEEKLTLSRLVITKDFRIFLPDYQNVEIIMPPLPKAVFLLFLRHPEGIAFKQLGDYYEELMEIYKRLSRRLLSRDKAKSIHDVTDPTKNSINEKCARIREAFLREFDEIYARNYYIVGKRGEPKKITLPRELLDLQAL